MAYTKSNLAAGERVIHTGKLHKIIFVLPTLLTLIALPSATEGMAWLLLVALGWLAVTYINYTSSEIVVTNKQVTAKVGFISRSTVETRLTKVEGIEVDQGVIGRMLDYGTVRVKGAGGTSKALKNISEPMKFRKRVLAEVDRIEEAAQPQKAA